MNEIVEIIPVGVSLLLLICGGIGSYTHFIVRASKMQSKIDELSRWKESHDKETGKLDEKLDEFEREIIQRLTRIETLIEKNGK